MGTGARLSPLATGLPSVKFGGAAVQCREGVKRLRCGDIGGGKRGEGTAGNTGGYVGITGGVLRLRRLVEGGGVIIGQREDIGKDAITGGGMVSIECIALDSHNFHRVSGRYSVVDEVKRGALTIGQLYVLASLPHKGGKGGESVAVFTDGENIGKGAVWVVLALVRLNKGVFGVFQCAAGGKVCRAGVGGFGEGLPHGKASCSMFVLYIMGGTGEGGKGGGIICQFPRVLTADSIGGQTEDCGGVVLVKVGIDDIIIKGVAVIVGKVSGGNIGGGEGGGVHCHNVTSGNALAVFVLLQLVKVKGEKYGGGGDGLVFVFHGVFSCSMYCGVG